MTEMRATRQTLGFTRCRDCGKEECRHWLAALAEVAVFERIAEAARRFQEKNQQMKGAVITSLDIIELADADTELVAALADLDRLHGQDSNAALTLRESKAACPCDGGEGCVCQ